MLLIVEWTGWLRTREKLRAPCEFGVGTNSGAITLKSSS